MSRIGYKAVIESKAAHPDENLAHAENRDYLRSSGIHEHVSDFVKTAFSDREELEDFVSAFVEGLGIIDLARASDE